MKPLYENEDKWREFKNELFSWLGTPYRHQGKLKGREADCTLFIAMCWLETGILSKVKHEYYPRDWHIHTNKELVLESMEYHFKNYVAENIEIIKLENNEKENFLRGDVLTFATFTSVTNHAGVWLAEGNQMINAVYQGGVCKITYGSWWDRKITGIYRLMEK